MEQQEKKTFTDYKWLYLWIGAAALLVFGALMIIGGLKGNETIEVIVLFFTGLLLIIWTLIRFVPLIKTTKNPWAIALNAMEMLIDLVLGIVMIVLTIKGSDNISEVVTLYPFILGAVAIVRGLVYLIEITFFGTKPTVQQFIVSLVCYGGGCAIMMSYEKFSIEKIAIIIGIIFLLCAIAAGFDGGFNYNNYRKKFILPYKKKETKVEKQDDEVVQDPVETEIIKQEDPQPQDYVN